MRAGAPSGARVESAPRWFMLFSLPPKKQTEQEEMSYPNLPQHNRLLAALSDQVRRRLWPEFELVKLGLGQVLYESGDMPCNVYFPLDAVVSLQYVTRNGACAEISMIGNEGLLGLSLIMSGQRPPSRAIVQCAGSALRIQGSRLRLEFDRHGELMALSLRHTPA